MDCAYIYEEINPCFRHETFLKDFEIFALDNLADTFELRKAMSVDDVRQYVGTVGD